MKLKRFKVTFQTTMIIEAPSEAWANYYMEERDSRAEGGVFRDIIPYHTNCKSDSEDYPEITEVKVKKGDEPIEEPIDCKRFTEDFMGVKLTDEEFWEEDPGIFHDVVANKTHEDES